MDQEREIGAESRKDEPAEPVPGCEDPSEPGNSVGDEPADAGSAEPQAWEDPEQGWSRA